jgi:4'-phosphopantetheinyl transferase EntD
MIASMPAPIRSSHHWTQPFPGVGSPNYLRALLPADVSVAETCEPLSIHTLHVEERAAIASAVPKRAVEFATGRWCASQTLAQLGTHEFPLLRNSDGAPLWPAEIVGSITHTEGYCAAAAGRRDRYAGVGIDAELDGRAGEEVWSIVFTAAEIAWLGDLPVRQRPTMATVLFSAKESFYKAQYPLTHAWLDFQAATVSVAGDTWALDVVNPQGALERLPFPVSGRFAIRDRLVVTAIAIDSVHPSP